MRLSGIRRYPVKSCRGEDLDSAVVEPWGLAGDRRWMLVDDTGVVITAREAHDLFLVEPTITPTGLRLAVPSRPDLPALDIVRPSGERQVPVEIWSSRLTAAPAPDATDWFSRLLDRPAHLVYLDDPTRRATSAGFSEPGDRVSFADGYPLLVATTASLAALDPELSMLRFRPNVVVDGAEAWAEDDWRRIRIGGVTFRAVKGCARCVMTTLDPDTGEGGKEPIATLARVRRFDGATWFGVNLIPDLPPGASSPTLRVGDDVEVLEVVPPGSGPLRVPAR